jgi:hypothetical protein
VSCNCTFRAAVVDKNISIYSSHLLTLHTWYTLALHRNHHFCWHSSNLNIGRYWKVFSYYQDTQCSCLISVYCFIYVAVPTETWNIRCVFLLLSYALLLFKYVVLLCLCILIVMYALFGIFRFYRSNWHSSATLTEVFSSGVRQMPG